MSSPRIWEVLRHLSMCDQPFQVLYRMHTSLDLHPYHTKPIISMTNCTHAPTVIILPTFLAQLLRFYGSSSCIRGNSSTKTGCIDNKRSLHVASRVKAFAGRPTNSGSTIPRRRCDRVSSVFSSRTVEVCRHFPTCVQPFMALSNILTTTSIPVTTQPTIAMTNYTHAPTVINSSAFHEQLLLLNYHRRLRMISEALELCMEGGRVNHQLVYVCSWSLIWWIGWGKD